MLAVELLVKEDFLHLTGTEVFAEEVVVLHLQVSHRFEALKTLLGQSTKRIIRAALKRRKKRPKGRLFFELKRDSGVPT